MKKIQNSRVRADRRWYGEFELGDNEVNNPLTFRQQMRVVRPRVSARSFRVIPYIDYFVAIILWNWSEAKLARCNDIIGEMNEKYRAAMRKW